MIRLPDARQAAVQENKASRLGQPVENPIFPDGVYLEKGEKSASRIGAYRNLC